jgi:molybdate transport system substrate-binding protein
MAGCSDTSADKEEKKTKLTISAAVSLSDALEEIKEIYEKDHPADITFQFGGSGTLAQQIRQGAPVDAFISANEEWMDALEKEKRIIPATRKNIAANKMVMVAGKNSHLGYRTPGDIAAKEIGRIAIGNPETVPAGKYAKDILQHLNKWDEWEKKLILAKDVRQVLAYVETGNADIGFVYASDAQASEKIQVLAVVDESLHEAIMYPAAVLANTKHEKEAEAFLNFLRTETAGNIFERYGFKKER